MPSASPPAAGLLLAVGQLHHPVAAGQHAAQVFDGHIYMLPMLTHCKHQSCSSNGLRCLQHVLAPRLGGCHDPWHLLLVPPLLPPTARPRCCCSDLRARSHRCCCSCAACCFTSCCVAVAAAVGAPALVAPGVAARISACTTSPCSAACILLLLLRLLPLP